MEPFLLKDIDVFDDKLTIEYETTRFSAADWQLTLRRLDGAGFQRRLEEALRIEHAENRGSRVVVWPREKRNNIPANRRITTYSNTTSVSDEYPIAELLCGASLKKKRKEKKKVCGCKLDRGCVGGGDMRMTLKRDSTQAIRFLRRENLTTTTRTYRPGGQWRQKESK